MRKITIRTGQSLVVEGDAEIHVEDGAQASIQIEPVQDTRIGIWAGAGSKISCHMVCRKRIKFGYACHVKADARAESSFLWLGSAEATVRNMLEGKGAQAYDIHAFVGKKNDELALEASLCHNQPDTKGDILVKGVVSDSASATLGGMIEISKKGAGAESFLAEHVLMLGHDAKASARPELEIQNNDVSSRHSASVSQIDEAKIFYLMSRGLGRKEACGLLVEGFLGSAMEKIADCRSRKTLQSEAGRAIGTIGARF